MDNFHVKKIIPVDNNLSLKECQKLLLIEGAALGILDENREITSFVEVEELDKGHINSNSVQPEFKPSLPFIFYFGLSAWYLPCSKQ